MRYDDFFEPYIDHDSPSRRLWEQSQRIIDRYNEQRREDELVERVMQRIKVAFED